MTEQVLFSHILPLPDEEDQKTIEESFREQIKQSDNLQISVGFASVASLTELDRLITESGIKKVCLILGMYFFNGFPKSLHELVLKINQKWQTSGIGEIRLIYPFKYHGKLYMFLKDENPFSAILGSANLSFLTSEFTHLHQYEIAVLFDNQDNLLVSLSHINHLKSPDISENVAVLEKEHKLFDINHMMDRIVGLSSVSKVETHAVKNLQLELNSTLEIPLIDLDSAENKKVSKRRKKKSYISLGVKEKGQKLLDESGSIDDKEWFYVVTDDGYEFMSYVEENKIKNLWFHRKDKVLERWIRGRIGGSLHVVDTEHHHFSDEEEMEREITGEMLKEYGGDHLVLTKTKNTKKDGKGIERDIWFLSFPRKSI
ncbi:hypothetical protein OVS_02785 [Mycoplasma ovis str. Michigan]|uniref:NgoFVII family restriction endonuclease n=1 Tax=Mycoplasma ovis str. Michigan TaxID=1415773 RepID=A0ABN4BM48_9MOLU|nr:restriction endonuclease PLD domain-containing protein [Mycoplasma ovis]AHC40356.1 hypothetical protein OVS_02785 [Mycoplasma ovis str. Michigan]